MANSLSQTQIYTILNAINAQAVLLSGYDNLMSAVSQVLSSTIFSHRPYESLLDILYADSIRYGNHVRKIVPLDFDAEADQRLPLTDGESVDPWVINKPKAMQFNFYGQEMFQRHISIPRDQIDTAFSYEEEFARFISMIYGNARDLLTQDEENVRRMCLANFIGGIYYTSPNSVVNLLTEYNAETGLSLTAQTVYQPDNYSAFMRWASARILNISDQLRQRGYRWHMNLTNKNIPRHTPKEYQKFIMYSPEYRKIESSTLSTTFHDDMIKGFDGFEAVNFFQNPDHPDQVNVTPSIIDASGEAQKADQIVVSKIFAMIFDRDAMGQTRINEWAQATPMNPAGGYTNMYWHRTNRWWNDFTENAVLFTLT